MKKTILCMILMVLCASNAFSAFFPIGIDWDIDDMDKKHVQYEFDSVSNGGPVFRILYPLAGGDMPHYFVLMSPDFEVTGMGAFADDRSDGSGITMKEVFDKYYNALVADHGFPLMKAKGNPADEDDVFVYRQGDEDIFEISPEFIVDAYWIGTESTDFLYNKYCEKDQYMCAWLVDSEILYIVAGATSATEWQISVYWGV